jgi:hypothetical protein
LARADPDGTDQRNVTRGLALTRNGPTGSMEGRLNSIEHGDLLLSGARAGAELHPPAHVFGAAPPRR